MWPLSETENAADVITAIIDKYILNTDIMVVRCLEFTHCDSLSDM